MRTSADRILTTHVGSLPRRQALVDALLQPDRGEVDDPAAILFEAANARHEPEWAVWQATKIPEDKILVPGTLDSCSNDVDPGELVARRIERHAGVAGRERVICGTDCGFGAFAGDGKTDADVSSKELRAMVEGVSIAAARLWPRRAA